MTSDEYKAVSAKITQEQDALRDTLSRTPSLSSYQAAKLTGKIDGLEIARIIVHDEVERR